LARAWRFDLGVSASTKLLLSRAAEVLDDAAQMLITQRGAPEAFERGQATLPSPS
jgi:hypothetical protein